MYGAIAGAGLSVAGAGLSAYGAHRQAKAMKAAQARYRDSIAAFGAKERASQQDFGQQYNALADQRMGSIGTALQDYMAPSYQTQKEDTATGNAALAQVRGGGEGQDPGLASTWGASVNAVSAGALSRQQSVQAGQNVQQRMGLAQSGALNTFSVGDIRLRQQQQNIHRAEQLRQALLAQQRQQMDQDAQATYDQASRAGQDWRTAGSVVGSLGGMAGSMG